jgi:AraC-like DNA-binding protein
METYSTRGLPAARKLSYWNQISSETFAAMEVRPRDSLGFDGLLRRAPLGPLTLMDVHSAAVRIRHTRSHIARAGDPSLLLLAPLQRSLQLSIDGGAVVTVGAGDFCFIDHARPYEIVHGDAVRTLCVDLPRRLIVPLVPRPERLAGRLMRPDSANARLLSAALRCLGEEMNPGASAQFSPEVAHGLLSLIVAAYAPRDDTTGGRSRGSRAQAFREHIDAYLGDPRLRPADVATRFGVSERYVRAVLGSGGESFTAHLLRRRLERCAALLADPASNARTITDIAFHAGFGNLTHFGRAFKARYAATPRDYRRARR